MVERKPIGIGLVGSGFMGRCHANAFRSVGGLFDLAVEPVPELLADATEDMARRGADALGYRRHTADWAALTADPAVDVVAVTAPNPLHEPIVLSAIENDKIVYCEKPLSVTAELARRMTNAAEARGVITLVGFNFLRNPMIRLAREIIAAGEIGDVVGFRGRHAESYMSRSRDAALLSDGPGGGRRTGRHRQPHHLARALSSSVRSPMSPPKAAPSTKSGQSVPTPSETAPVLVDDMTHALVRFESGAAGSIEANWVATGRTMDLSFEITGTDRRHRLQPGAHERTATCGGRTKAAAKASQRIEAGPAHPPYGSSARRRAITLASTISRSSRSPNCSRRYPARARCFPDFREALAVQETVEADQTSARTRRWVPVATHPAGTSSPAW